MNRRLLFYRWLAVAAMAAAVSVPSTAESKWKLGTSKQEWAITSGVPAAANARSMAVSDGKVYTLSNGSAATMYYTDLDSKKFTSFAVGQKTPCNIAADDKGNLIFPTGITLGAKDLTSLTLCVLPAGTTSKPTSYTTVTLTVDNFPRFDFLSASGNLLSADGGYVYFRLNGKPGLYRIKMTYASNKLTAGATEIFTSPNLTNANTTAWVKPNPDQPTEVTVWAGASTGSNKLYTLDESAKTATYVKNSSIEKATRIGAMTVGTGEKKFAVYNNCTGSGWKVTSTGFIVENFNDATQKVEVKIHTNTVDYGTSGWNVTSTAGLLLDAKIEGNTLHVYAFQPGVGAWHYTVPLTEAKEPPLPAKNLKADYTVNQIDAPNRVDCVISWEKSETETVHKHRVERKVGNDWKGVATLSTNAYYTVIDASVGDTYRIVAIDDNGLTATSEEIVLNPPFYPYMPQNFIVKSFDGYAKVRLRWHYRDYGKLPAYYEIYRDGVMISPMEQSSNYVDRYVPAGEHTYQICSVYLDSDGNQLPDKGWSVEKTVNVVERDVAMTQYGIDEIYNYRIDAATHKGTFHFPTQPTEGDPATKFNDQELYRQGAFYKGYWFVAQRENDIEYIDGVQQRGKGTMSGIIRFDAQNPGTKEQMSKTAKYIYTTEEKCANVGIAIDEEGTIFKRLATNPNSVWDYSAKITKGRFLKLNSTLDGIERQVDIDFGDALGNFRCDYYSMSGKVLSEEGGYVYFAETNTSNMYRCFFQNGKLVKTEKFDHSTDVEEEKPTSVTAENYCYPLAGRNDVMHEVRSTGYYHVDLAANKSHRVLEAYTRVNNAGGMSFFFDNRMFIICPESPHSKNVGNFYITMATSKDGLDGYCAKPEDAVIELPYMLPVLTYKQPDLAQYGVADSNANGNWYGCVPAADEGVDDGKGGFFLYQYVPGIRFAKYRIYPLKNLPKTDVTMVTNVRYDEARTEIKAIDGKATWQTVQGYDQNVDVPSPTTIHRYMVEFTDKGGRTFETRYFDAVGTERLSAEVEAADTETRIIPTTDKTMSADVKVVDEENITARVTVLLRDRNTNFVYSCDPAWATHHSTYESQPATHPAVNVYSCMAYPPEGPCAHYRMDFDFQAPVFDNQEEPVTYYQVEVLKDGSTQWEVIPELYYTSPQPASMIRSQARAAGADDGDRFSQVTDRIPGTYDFGTRASATPETDKDGQPIPVSVVSAFVQIPWDEALKSNPITWRYRIAARYAADEMTPRAGFASIARNEYATPATVNYGGLTGIESVESPIPTSGDVYNLQGILIIRDATEAQIQALPAGVYIIGGHKLYVR